MNVAPLEGAVCIPNISRREGRKRLRFGAVQAGAALLLLATQMVRSIDRRWRLALFPVWFGAASGYFQWRDKT